MLSFGEEAEEDEAETHDFVQKNTTKSKSVHDVIDDPKLSKQTVVIDKQNQEDDGLIEERDANSENDEDAKEKAERIRDKLKSVAGKSEKSKRKISTETKQDKHESSSDDDIANELENERKLKRQKKVLVS